MTRRLALRLVLAVALALAPGLAGCGKKGPLERPDDTKPGDSRPNMG